MQKKAKQRAQLVLASMFLDAREVIFHLHRLRPRIFRRNLEKILFESDNSKLIGSKLSEAADFILRGREINWRVMDQVGLTGSMLEWKSDLFYNAIGKTKPSGDVGSVPITQSNPLSYSEAKPVWGRFFKYLRSLLGSLMQAVTEGTKLKYIFDFIKEYVECLDASVKFVQIADEPLG